MIVKSGTRGLGELARLYGVEMSYEAMDGSTQKAGGEALALTLQALGAEIGSGHDARHALRARRAELDALGIQRCALSCRSGWNPVNS
jgi:hypothetical protein